MPRGVKRSELEIVEAEIKKLEAKIDTAQSSLKKDKSSLSKLRIKRESLMAHDLIRHAKEKSLSLDDVKALMESAGDKAVSATKDVIHKAEGALEDAEKKLSEKPPAPEKKAASSKTAAKKAPTSKGTPRKTPTKKAEESSSGEK